MNRNWAFCQLTDKDELQTLQVNHPKFTAEICLQGAQLTRFQAKDNAPLLWLSEQAQYKAGQSLRGGIPICWPWFGALDKNPKQIKQNVRGVNFAHGFARTQAWQLSSIKESCHQVEVTLTLQHNANTLKIWPYEFALQCRFTFSQRLSIALTTTNLADKPLHFSEALHTYLPTNNIHKNHILAPAPCQYVDALDDWQLKPQRSSIRFNQETDRIYRGQGNWLSLNHPQHIQISSNAHDSVIWNPWREKSKRLSQFNHHDYQSMLCIESANVLEHAITLPAKESHTLSLHLSQL